MLSSIRRPESQLRSCHSGWSMCWDAARTPYPISVFVCLFFLFENEDQFEQRARAEPRSLNVNLNKERIKVLSEGLVHLKHALDLP